MEKYEALDPSQLLSLLQQEAGVDADGEGPELADLLRGGGAQKASHESITIFPEPGFVVKTADETGRKVFLNVCASDKVGLPGGWAAGEVPPEARRMLEQGGGSAAASELLRFPLSLSPPQTEADHRGEPCTVFDVVFNTDLLRQAATFRPLKYFLVQLAMGWAEQKHQLSLDPQYKLPKMRYKGDAPLPHVLRAEAASSAGGGQGHAAHKPLICEVQPPGAEAEAPSLRLPVNAAAAKAAAAVAAGGSSRTAGEGARGPAAAGVAKNEQEALRPVLQHTVEFDGRPVQRVRISVQLPAGAATTARRHPDALQVVVAGEVVRVQAPGCQPLVLTLPLAAAAQGGAAELAADGSSLLLLLPVMTVSELVAAARRGTQRRQQVHETGSSGVMELD